MKISKKLLSLLLAVTMLVSVFSIAASAVVTWTNTGVIEAGNVNVKYTVAKATEAPMADGSGSYTGDDIYAVTIWAQSDNPLGLLTATVHYDKALFTPLMIWDGEVTYPLGAGLDPETYYTDMSEGSNYIYSYGSYTNDTGMYNANGKAVTSKALARYIGIGNSNHDGIKTYSEYISPDHPNFARFAAGVDTDKYGIMYLNVDVSAVVKSAYFNTYHNGTTFAINTDWIDMGVLYFQRNEGVTDADCVGATFGNSAVNSFNMDGVTDLCGTLYCTTSTTATVPEMNLVSNATVEAAKPDPVVTVVEAQSKWAKGVAGQDYLFGYVGQIANFTPVVENGAEYGELENVTSITATATINGTPATSEVITIWKDGDVYKFRASFSGFDYTVATVIENIVFTVVTTDGTYSSSNYVANTDNVKAIYDASVAKGLTAA